MLFNQEGENLIGELIYLGHGLAFSPVYLMFLNVLKGLEKRGGVPQWRCLWSVHIVICVKVKVVRCDSHGLSDLDHAVSLAELFVTRLIDISITF